MNLFADTQPQHPQESTERPRAASVASARTTDPQTSRDAARRHEASGNATCNRERLLNEVCRGPGRTAAELCQRLDGIDPWESNRRLADLRNAGLVESHTPRECSIKGSKCMTWWATAEGREAGPKLV